jgi:ABC-type amino acid transport system permease subunit
MLTVIFALLAGVGFQELLIAFVIFTVPLFFLVRWMLRKVWMTGSRQSINIVSVVLAIVLTPVVTWLVIMAIIVAWAGS